MKKRKAKPSISGWEVSVAIIALRLLIRFLRDKKILTDEQSKEILDLLEDI